MNKQVCLGLCLATLALSACEAPVEEVAEVIRPVRYVEVAEASGQTTRIFSGVTKAALETDLSFKVSGLLTTLNANVGDLVEKGQLIAMVDPTDYEVTLREAEAGLERAKAEERNAEAGFERTRELYENRNASRSDLDTARAMAESVAAQVRAMSQQVEGVRLQLSYTRLISPLRCSIATRHVETNQNVSAGQPIVRINCGDCAEVRVDVPGVYIGRIESGTSVAVDVASLPGDKLAGVVTEVGIGTDQNRSIYPVTVKLNNGCDDVRSGMAADITFVLTPDRNSDDLGLFVPLVSVGEDREGNFVFLLEPAEGFYVARRRTVEIGPPDAQGIYIVAGLSAGDLIATAGVRRLVDGQKVSLLGEQDKAALTQGGS